MDGKMQRAMASLLIVRHKFLTTKSRINLMEKRGQELSRDLDFKSAAISRADAALAEKQSLLSALDDKLQATEERRHAAESQARASVREAEEAASAKRILLSDINDAKDELDAVVQEVSATELKLLAVQDQLAKLETIREDLLHELSKDRAAHKKIRDDVRTAHHNLQSRETEAISAAERLQTLTQHISEKQARLRADSQELETIEAAKQRAKRQLESLEEKQAEVETAFAGVTNKYAQMLQAVGDAQKSYSVVLEEIAMAKRTKQAVDDEAAAARDLQQDLQQSVARVRKQLGDLAAEKEGLAAAKADAEAEALEAQGRRQKIQDEVALLKTKHAAILEMIAQAEKVQSEILTGLSQSAVSSECLSPASAQTPPRPRKSPPKPGLSASDSKASQQQLPSENPKAPQVL
jgi:predicted  nucleic acid-binding Zn-ribbon protein